MTVASARTGWLVAGTLLLAATWIGPLPELSRHSFASHMAMHMSVVAQAIPSAPGLGSVGTILFSPIVASVVEFIVVWSWHAPALHHAARHSTALLVLEQAGFLAVGLLVWLAAFGGGPAQRRSRAAAGVGGLLLTSMHMTLLGVLLALAARPLYPHGAAPAFGLTAMQDQHLGGILMLLFGGLAYLAGALALLLGLLRDRDTAVAHG